MTTVPLRLLIRSGSPSRTQVDHLPDEDLEVDPRGVAERGAHRHHPADVAGVVGAEHDDAAVEAPLALVEVVGEVARDVGGVAVALDDDPVLVVAELGGAQPERAVLLEHPAGRLQPVDGALDGAGLVQVVLVEEHVELDAEVAQRRLDLLEHALHAVGAEDLLRVVLLQRVRDVGQHRLRDLADVGAAVAVLRCRLALRDRQQRPREAVDLRAVVVEVVLAGDLRAARLEQPGERVADGGPAHAARWIGPVGLAETNSRLTVCPAAASPRPYAGPCRTTVRTTSPSAPWASRRLRKPGPATSTSATPSTSRSRAASSSATSRGFLPAALASCSATLVA